MLAIWSLVPLPFLNPAWTSGSSHFTYCWSLAWRILSITLLPCEMSVIVWYFEHPLALPFFGIGMKTDLTAGIGYGTVSVLIFSCENSKITTHCWTTIDRRMLDPTIQRYPISKGKRRNPNKMVGGVKSHLESNTIPTRDTQRAQTQSCVHQGIPQRLSQTCLWVFESLLWRNGPQWPATGAGTLSAAFLSMA